jgi:hypothetical protein
MKKPHDVHGGNYYGRRDADGPLEPAAPQRPDHVICRRVADYNVPLPPSAATTICNQCAAPIAFNPKGPHQDVKKICMQCARIRPLTITPDEAAKFPK